MSAISSAESGGVMRARVAFASRSIASAPVSVAPFAAAWSPLRMDGEGALPWGVTLGALPCAGALPSPSSFFLFFGEERGV